MKKTFIRSNDIYLNEKEHKKFEKDIIELILDYSTKQSNPSNYYLMLGLVKMNTLDSK